MRLEGTDKHLEGNSVDPVTRSILVRAARIGALEVSNAWSHHVATGQVKAVDRSAHGWRGQKLDQACQSDEMDAISTSRLPCAEVQAKELKRAGPRLHLKMEGQTKSGSTV
jgi:hypothetical protein